MLQRAQTHNFSTIARAMNKPSEYSVSYVRYGSVLKEKYSEQPCFRQLQTFANISGKRADRDILWVISGRSFYYPLRSDEELEKLLAMEVLQGNEWIINAYLPSEPNLTPGHYDGAKLLNLPQDLALCREARFRTTRLAIAKRVLK